MYRLYTIYCILYTVYLILYIILCIYIYIYIFITYYIPYTINIILDHGEAQKKEQKSKASRLQKTELELEDPCTAAKARKRLSRGRSCFKGGAMKGIYIHIRI